MSNNRKKIGIVVDYSIRNPRFIEAYTALKKILMGDDDTGMEIPGTKGWIDLKRNNEKEWMFYVKTPVPVEDENFDLTWSKYFYNQEHKRKFMEDFAFNLYNQGGVISKADVNNLNLMQTHRCDVYLIDRTHFSRKLMNTYSFLSRSGLITKGLIFVASDEEIQGLEKEFIGIYNPYKNKPQTIFQPTKKNKKIVTTPLTQDEQEDEEIENIIEGTEIGQIETDTPQLLSFLMDCEKKIINLKETKE